MTAQSPGPDAGAAASDLYLGYCGGSGGFILLHLLLCSGDFFVDFADGRNFDDVLESQWQITKSHLWKSTEAWPDRWNTIWADSPLPRIYFYCNPAPGTYFEQPQHYILEAYGAVKDGSWPDIHSFEDYTRLSQRIKEECEIQHKLSPLVRYYSGSKKFVWIYTDVQSQIELSFYKKAHWYYRNPTLPKHDLQAHGIYRDCLVDIEAMPFLPYCDVKLRLQDVISDPEVLVHQGLIKLVNTQQRQLIHKWLSLHPPELLEKIGLAGLSHSHRTTNTHR
jgi:hypothetical protein